MKKLCVLTISLLLASLNAAQIPADQLEFFENKIRPVLAESCYECHNSVNKKKGKLAVDWKGALLEGGSEGKAVIPGDPENSLLIKSIRHEDDLEMPSKAPKLSDEVIADFVKWVKMGAPDPRTKKPTAEDLKNSEVKWETVRDKRKAKWWSFHPPKSTEPARPDNPEWQKNKIDAYIFEGFKKAQLSPSSKADKYTLIRRLSLILRGLPPSQQEVNEFVSSKDPKAYDKLVDNFLNTNEYGEKWARHWMDWYRFAQTHGSESDPQIPFAEAYRDYLIRALNADVPYDQLLKEHLAGDLMKNPRINKELGINESAIGPAHLRMVPHGFGVTDAYDEQITFTDNQVDVISKAMMGLTVSCARCHHHKFDPISQEDFYRFYGVMISNKPSTVIVDSKEKQDKNKDEIISIKSEIRQEIAKLWLNQVKEIPLKVESLKLFDTQQLKLPPIPKGKKLSRKENQKRKAEQNRINAINDRNRAVKEFTHPLSAWSLINKPAKQIQNSLKNFKERLNRIRTENDLARKEAIYHLDLRDSSKAGKFYTSGNGISTKISPAGSFALNHSGEKAITGIYPSGIYSHLISTKHAAVLSTGDFYLKGNHLSAHMASLGAQVRMPIRSYPLTHGGLHPARVVNTPALHWNLVPGKMEYWKGEKVHMELRTAKEMFPRSGGDRSWFGVTEVVSGKRRIANEGASLVDMVDFIKITSKEQIEKAYTQVLTKAIKNWQSGKISNKEAIFLQGFVEYNLLENNLKNLPASLKDKISKYRQLENEIPVPTRAPGVLEAEIVNMPLLDRGNYNKEGEPVTRHFLEIFSRKAYTKGSGRLELAEDMVSSANTLKSRLIVNRLWHYVFGQGIVKTTDNFGRLGDKPTHPELLDYLAINFEKNGWSLKKALREMVTSRTFRSVSQNSKVGSEKDPLNNYLSYFTPRRLEAEAIFDSYQKISGKKTKRAVYDRVIRNRLNPFLTTFNRPTPVTTVSARLSTNVPAQALTMMNNFAANMAGATTQVAFRAKTLKTDEDKIRALFMQCYLRPATDSEIKLSMNFLKQINMDWQRFAEALLNSKEIIYVY